jgi:hypothetical protein
MRRSNFRGRARVAAIAGAVVATTGCNDVVRNTELEPEGPPEILQVFVRERVENPDDGSIGPGLRLAFGDHPDAGEEDDREVTDAIASTEQRIRIVIDELLLGNSLEEVMCVNPGTWSRVPVGTTPDDLRRCIGSDLSRCEAVCKDQGGVADGNDDLSVDDTRLIDGVITLSCGGIAVPIDRDRSFYSPSGNQLVPAGALGFDGLGPALVVVPAESLPTSSACSLALAAEVTDKQGERPCAAGAAGCVPGDMSGVTFSTEPLQVMATHPESGATDVALVDEGSTDATITIEVNGWLDPATVAAGVVLSAGGAPVAGATAALETVQHDDGSEAVTPTVIVITVAGGLTAGTEYTVTFPGDGAATTLRDKYGAAVPEAPTLTFTTVAAPAAGSLR